MSISSDRAKRFCANFRIVSSGPESESGGMIAFTRDPSGRRASTSGRRLVDPSSDLADHLRDDPAQVRRVGEGQCGLRQQAGPLDPDVLRTVDHDLRHRRVGEQALERPVAEDVVGDLGARGAAGRLATAPSPARAGRRSRTRHGSRTAPLSSTSKRRGPSSLTSARWIRFFSSAKGSDPLPFDVTNVAPLGELAMRSCSSIVNPPSAATAAAVRCRWTQRP